MASLGFDSRRLRVAELGAEPATQAGMRGAERQGARSGRDLTHRAAQEPELEGTGHQGQVAATKVGALPKSKIKEWIESSV